MVSISNDAYISLPINGLQLSTPTPARPKKRRLDRLIFSGAKISRLRPPRPPVSVHAMDAQTQYDDAMFDFSQGEFGRAIEKLQRTLAATPENFDAQLALGMAYYRLGDYAAAIAEGHKAEKLRPREQLVHTNLSLFYMKSGDKVTAEKHGLQAKIEGWREEGKNAGEKKIEAEAELQMAKPTPQPVKFPSQPWKKQKQS